MKKRKLILLIAVSWVLALLAVSVPAGLCIRDQVQKYRVLAQLRQGQTVTEEGLRRHWNLAKWYNRNLTLEESEPGFREAYGTILRFDGGWMGYLILEEGWQMPLLSGDAADPPAWAAIHAPETAFPVGSRGNHTVLDLGELSRRPALWQGVTICLPGKTLMYRVDEVQTGPGELWYPDPDRDLLTLVLRWNGREYRIRCSAMETIGPVAEHPRGEWLWAGCACALGMTGIPVCLCLADRNLRLLRRGRGKRSALRKAMIEQKY